MKQKLAALLFFICIFFNGIAQDDDLLSLLEQNTPKETEKVFATFKGRKMINLRTVETVKKNELEFMISHRFGDLGSGNDVLHTYFGMDNASDIQLSFTYGILDNLNVGIARSRMNELVEGNLKFIALQQTKNNKIPVTVGLYTSMGYDPRKAQSFYGGLEVNKRNDLHRLSYYSNILIARKFTSWFSLQVGGGYHHRNFVPGFVNKENKAEEQNGFAHANILGRIKFTKRFGIIADYTYIFSQYRTGNKANPYYNPLGIGLELETGGHVFQLNLSNARAISEINYLPNTNDAWSKGQYKICFNITRTFGF